MTAGKSRTSSENIAVGIKSGGPQVKSGPQRRQDVKLASRQR
jgi:hypothetical protein